MATHKKPNEYLKIKIQTATATELLLMLFDGAIRFAKQGKEHLERTDYEHKNEVLLRAQAIVLELLQALDRRLGDELYSRLVHLYRFCYERLIQANLRDDAGAIDEALAILEHLRETWRQAVAKAEKEASAPVPQERRALCLEG